MAKAGRKGKYEEWLTNEGLLRIQGWARDGLIDKQIAENMGIGMSTLSEWKTKFPELVAALKAAKEVVDRQVENALIKNALGWEYDETTQEPDKGGKLVVTKVVHKIVQPNVTAQIFWLKNRMPDEYRDVKDIHMSGNVDVASVIEERIKQKEKMSTDD